MMRISFIARGDISTAAVLAVLWSLAAMLTAWSLHLVADGRRLKD
jgi:hypothetical protein